jgi:hypothetical protein
MAGYYDQLEAQLADATERLALRGRFARRLPSPLSPPWLRVDVLAVSASVAVAVIVAVVFIAAGGKHAPVPPVAAGAGGPPVIRNYAPAPAPPLAGQLVCDSALLPPGRRRHPSNGVAVVHTGLPNRYVFSITAGGLKPAPPGYVDAFWIQPELTVLPGGYELVPHSKAELVGVIQPAVGAGGGLAAEGLLPPVMVSAYRLTITLQPASSTTAPGKTLLEGHVTL